MASLPEFIEPMLARAAEPFDSDQHLYEIKWDGFRALCFAQGGECRIIGRRKSVYTQQYPELAGLQKLPDGTVLDGEVVAMRNGKPDFVALLQRQGRPDPRKRSTASVVYVAFDLLYEGFSSQMNLPCEQRRDKLAGIVERLADKRVVMSQSLAGCGKDCFAQVVAMGLEGVVAKKRNSKYEPGRRSDCWLKFKQVSEMVVAIIGYEPSDERGLRSLIIAAESDGEFRHVGQVGSGIPEAMLGKLLDMLNARLRKTPVVLCRGVKGRWVELGLYCRISYLEWLPTGKLRAPVFRSLYVP